MKHMHIDKEIKNSEVKGKSLICFLSNPEHKKSQNITGATISGSIDQGLQKQRAISVKPFPILRQSMGGERKDLARQSLDADPGQHEEAAIGNDELKAVLALFRAPSDPCVAGRHLPGRAGNCRQARYRPGSFKDSTR